jgi:hypothetical protein
VKTSWTRLALHLYMDSDLRVERASASGEKKLSYAPLLCTRLRDLLRRTGLIRLTCFRAPARISAIA